jgi:uronate dehydrogenase
MKKILLTGAAGLIGKVLREGLKGQYELIRCMDIAPQTLAGKGEEVIQCDLRDIKALEKAMQGIDTVIHLAGVSVEDSWEKILPANIEGCYNTFDCAYRAGVKRMIFASSNHAVGFHRRERFIDTQVEHRPDGRYGVSKVFGEALGRLYADKYGMQVVCLRIGSFRPDNKPADVRQLNTWISHNDMIRLTKACLDHAGFHFEVIYGVSKNLRNRWDNILVKHLGYDPQDDAEIYRDEMFAKGLTEDPVSAVFHGAMYCPMEFVGDVDKIL